MKFRKNKKGFTIVELVIVIAVIGILTAVMVPTIIHLVGKANKASDDALISNLNKAVALKQAEDGKPETMHDTVKGLEEYGYKLDALVAKSDQSLLYDLAENEFLLAGEAQESKKADYWQIRDNADDVETYNIYASSKFNVENVTGLKVGFDAGFQENVSSVEYVGTRDALVRTNGGKFTVNAPEANVKHYGTSGKVMIEAVKSESYHEKGVVENIEIKAGRVEVETEAVVGTILVSGNDVKVETANEEVEVKVAEGVTGAQVTGVTPEEVKLVSTLSGLVANDKVALSADLTGLQTISVANVEIDLNGHSITNSGTAFYVNGVAGVKLTGNGLIKSTGNNGVAVTDGGLTIDTVTVEAQEFALVAFHNGALTVNSGKFIAHDNAVIGTNGSKSSKTDHSGYNIVINGGEFIGTIQSAGYIACGIYHANAGELTINGGEFNITNGCGVLCRSGEATIGENVVINLHNDADNPVRGKVGDSKVMVLTGAYVVKDNAAHYPGGEPVVTNNSVYSLTELDSYN